MKDLRDDLKSVTRWLASSARDHDLNDLINAVGILTGIVEELLPVASPESAEITLFKKPNDPNERVNKPNYNPPSFEDFDK